jgi:hypothetical protein
MAAILSHALSRGGARYGANPGKTPKREGLPEFINKPLLIYNEIEDFR